MIREVESKNIVAFSPEKWNRVSLKEFYFIFNEIFPMSIPKRKRGFRKIVLDNNVFNWRFNSQIEVCPANRKDNRIIVDFGWFNSFLYLNDKSAIPPNHDPKVVTPSFVRKVIEFALIHNWDITARSGVTKVTYRDNQFNIILPS
jgi:hypothetical protein